jgi:predicted  nucleic acid-binding Zn-ribbon protein
MSRSQKLLEIQRIDLERDALIAALARVMAGLKGNPEVVAAQREVRAAAESLAEVQPILQDQDLERQSVKAHIAREEGKLYGGRVAAPKELQNYELEIASLKRHLAELDDAALETLLLRDEASERLHTAETTLQETEAGAVVEHGDLTRKKREIAAEIRQFDADRAELVAALPPTDVQFYERVRKAKGGRAMAKAGDGTCSACGVLLPRQEFDRVRDGDDLIPCPGCGRVLCA